MNMNIQAYVSKLIKYEPLLEQLVIRDLKIKYRRSFLGYIWSLLNPLMMMGILTMVFSYMFRFDIPNYPLYLITGQVVFNFIAESTTAAMASIINNASLLKKVYVPKFIFPLSRIVSSFVTMLFSMVAVLIVMVFTGTSLKCTLFLLPIPMFFLFIFALGIGLILAALTVYFRDVFHLYGVFISLWSFVTPVFYPVSAVPDQVKYILLWNPLYYIVDYFRQIILYDTIPGFSDTVFCLALSVGPLLLGMFIFKKLQKNFLLYV